MNHLIRRNAGRRNAALIARACAETLESRRLLSLLLSLNNGVLTMSETTDGVANYTIVQLSNDSTRIQVSESGDTLNENTALFDDGWTVNNQNYQTASGPETGISSIVIDTDDGQDTLQIPNMNLPVLIKPRKLASENISLGDADSPTGAQGITQPISFDGTNAGLAEISVEDRMDPNNVDPTLTSTSLLNFAGAPINFIAPPRGSSAFPLLGIDCSAGTSTSGFILDQDPANSASIGYQVNFFGTGTFGIENLNATSQVTLVPQTGGSVEARLGSFGLISGIHGLIDVQGNAGTASLVVDDSNDPVSHAFITTTNGSELLLNEDGVRVVELDEPSTGFTLETGTAGNTVNLNLNGLSSGSTSTLQSGGSNDAVSVSSLPSGSTLDVIGGGTGVDNLSIQAVSVLGTVNVSDPTGLEAVSIDASHISAPQVISVNDARVTGIGTSTFTLANLQSLSVVGGSAFDNFSVTPSVTALISVDGGTASGAPTDRLDVSTTGVTGTALTLQSGGSSETGTYTFANRQPVNFTRFATITPTIGDLTGTVYDEQTAAAVAGALVVVDENNNGVADVGEPTTTADSNGGFSFQGLPAGTFALLASSAGLQNLSTFSVTVSAGALATPVLVPVIPVASASGPDLTASIMATASGKTGSIKPRVRVKVTNLGSSMASAADLQIVLAASADNVLDPADPQLLNASTAPVLLKANKSKTFVLTGSTAASLARGNYFVLASVDAANAVAESNEANNVAVSTKPVTLAPPVADLTGKFGKLPKSASKSKVLAVSLSIQNLGTISAVGTIDVDFFASTDKTLDGSDVSLGTGFPVAVHAAAGKSQAAHFKLSITPTLPAGSYYLVARVNSTSSIPESDSTNNILFSATPIAIS